MKNKQVNIVVSAGGTGGHVFPAIAFSKELIKQVDCNCYFITDSRVANSKNFNLSVFSKVFKIQGAGIVNLSFVKKIINASKLLFGLLQSFYLLLRLKPKLIVTFGGYITLPVAISAYVLRIPIVIHEQNKVPSSANVLLAKIASFVAVSFKNTKGLSGKKVVHTGMPIRASFFNQNIANKDDNKFKIAFLGGSLGAKSFALNIPNALSKLTKQQQEKLVIYHQCRNTLTKDVQNAYKQTHVSVELQPFFKNVEEIIQTSNLIFTRAGASTVFEVMQRPKHVVFVPFPYAANNHQYHNAMHFKDQKGVQICQESDFNAEYIKTKIEQVLAGNVNIGNSVDNKNTLNGSLELVKLCRKYF